MDRGNYGRGYAGAARGRGGDGGRGRGGGGIDGGRGRGDGGRGRGDGGRGRGDGGDGRGRGRGGRGDYQNQPQYHKGQYQQQGWGYQQQQVDGSGRGRVGSWGPNQSVNNPPPPAGRGYRPSAMGMGAGSSSSGVGVGGRGGGWGPPASDRTWVQTPPPVQQQQQQQQPDLSRSMSNLTVGERQPLLCLEDVGKNKVVSMKRPDRGGANAVNRVPLLVNHFPVRFDQNTIIRHYDVDITQEVSSKGRIVKKPVLKSELRSIREKLFADDPTRFPLNKTAYDGEKNIFSAVPLPTGHYNVELSDGEGEDRKSRSYTFSIQLVNEVRLSKLKSYLNAEVMDIPREILQGMDLVMKENPSRHRISFGRSSYPKEYRSGDDLHCGVAAFRGFQHSLKPTSQGLALCLDYSVMALRKRMPVLDYLKENVPGFRGVHDIWGRIGDVTKALKGLKVTVIHRITKQKYTITGLTKVSARELSFDLEDLEGKDPPTKVGLLSYFLEKYQKDIEYKDIPCLDVGKNKRKNYLPMEFAVLVEGQRYHKDLLSKESAALPLFRKISMLEPKDRKDTILEMVRSDDGPCGGEVIGNFDLEVVKNMTKVPGRVIGPPRVMLGKGKKATIRMDKCQWNLLNDSVVEGKAVERWALIDFSSNKGRFRLNANIFVEGLVSKCVKMGIRMDYPLFHQETNMDHLRDVEMVRKILNHVIVEASKNSDGGGGLQMIVCVMTERAPGYKYLKWVSETQIGVLTQCCLASTANKEKGRDQFFANMALKINAKLGGINFELMDRLPRFEGGEHVMFIGADVNHPAPFNASSPSIVAVVATVGWPSINKYAARVCPQEHRKEKIVSFGSICLDLVNTYARFNGVKPMKIVVFRDGVSEGQFDMVLNEELVDLKRAIYKDNYQPTITLVVAQKRHQTRLFLENEQRDGVRPGNVPPGTVVDTIVVHPFEFDFYLCSHFGGIGTSKPTHYYVLWDENWFTSDQLQKLIYDLCFTFARCTKPVSLVPPVYYADLVAYRGRMFQEVAMEMQPPPYASSSSSVVSSSSTNSFDESFYKLHSDLENIMFFV